MDTGPALIAKLEIIQPAESVPYREAHAMQLARRDAIARGEAGPALFLLEHPPVFTMGRNAHDHHLLRSPDELARMGIEVVEADRGGDVTYHGPGQLVAYPIINLEHWRPSVPAYLRNLEQVLIDLLAGYGLHAKRNPPYTGVWVDGAKVAAIGIAVHRWVAFHGIALNVAPNMAHWQLIIPCGIPDKPVTSLREHLPNSPLMGEVKSRFAEHFLRVFELERVT